MYYDLSTKSFVPAEPDNHVLSFLYNTVVGRVILKVFTTKLLANTVALYNNSCLSKLKIKKFIKKHDIDMDQYVFKKYKSFNDFFIREIKKEERPINDGFISICDSKLLVYKINNNSKFNVKNSIYTVEELIGEKRKYKYALVFRLCVTDYHHYIFPDNGKIVGSKVIPGTLHTVQPIAQKRYKVFHENAREVTFLECDNLGDVCYVEVGAMIVGKIVNEPVTTFKRAEEKGHFEFGGSTVIMLINKEIDFVNEIIRNSEDDIETIVKLGEKLSK